MQLALGLHDLSAQSLAFARQIGVTHAVVISPEAMTVDGPFYDYERLVQMRQHVESHGLSVAAIQNIPPAWYDQLIYGGPQQAEQLSNYCRTVENVGRAGIPALHYNFHAQRVWRTSRHTLGRGGAYVTAYDHALMADAPLAGPRPIGDDDLWERLETLVKTIVPVAHEYGVRMALHPDDPPVSPIAGAACILRNVEAFQRVLDMVDSPANGILFCQGCFAEMLGQGVYDAIRHFGRQNRIVYVHFRNVSGTAERFRETFIDAGDIDMRQAMRVYKEVGFAGAMIPDHLPKITGDDETGGRAVAHAVGYMRAMMQAVER